MKVQTSSLQAHELDARRAALATATYVAWWESALADRERREAFAARVGGYHAGRGQRAA